MISLSKNRTSLANLGRTINALEKIEDLIEYYSQSGRGPAYLQIRYAMGEPEIQMDRSIIVDALHAQREKLLDYFAALGIDASDLKNPQDSTS